MTLREWLGDLSSLEGIRTGNFERCVRAAGGVELVQRPPGGGTGTYVVQVRRGGSLDDDLARMLNTRHVRIASLSNERGGTRLRVEVS